MNASPLDARPSPRDAVPPRRRTLARDVVASRRQLPRDMAPREAGPHRDNVWSRDTSGGQRPRSPRPHHVRTLERAHVSDVERAHVGTRSATIENASTHTIRIRDLQRAHVGARSATIENASTHTIRIRDLQRAHVGTRSATIEHASTHTIRIRDVERAHVGTRSATIEHASAHMFLIRDLQRAHVGARSATIEHASTHTIRIRDVERAHVGTRSATIEHASTHTIRIRDVERAHVGTRSATIEQPSAIEHERRIRTACADLDFRRGTGLTNIVRTAHIQHPASECVSFNAFDRALHDPPRGRVHTTVHVDDTGKEQRTRASKREDTGHQGVGTETPTPSSECWPHATDIARRGPTAPRRPVMAMYNARAS